MSDKIDFKEVKYEEVKEKKKLSEIPASLISILFAAISIFMLPLFTSYKKMEETDSGYNVMKFFAIFGVLLIIALIIVEIIIPLRLFIRHTKERKDYGFAKAVFAIIAASIFVMCVMLLFGFLLVF